MKPFNIFVLKQAGQCVNGDTQKRQPKKIKFGATNLASLTNNNQPHAHTRIWFALWLVVFVLVGILLVISWSIVVVVVQFCFCFSVALLQLLSASLVSPPVHFIHTDLSYCFSSFYGWLFAFMHHLVLSCLVLFFVVSLIVFVMVNDCLASLSFWRINLIGWIYSWVV